MLINVRDFCMNGKKRDKFEVLYSKYDPVPPTKHYRIPEGPYKLELVNLTLYGALLGSFVLRHGGSMVGAGEPQLSNDSKPQFKNKEPYLSSHFLFEDTIISTGAKTKIGAPKADGNLILWKLKIPFVGDYIDNSRITDWIGELPVHTPRRQPQVNIDALRLEYKGLM